MLTGVVSGGSPIHPLSSMYFSPSTLNLGTLYYKVNKLFASVPHKPGIRYRFRSALIADAEAYHGIYILEPSEGCKSAITWKVTTVEIVAIDNSKRFLYYITLIIYSMVGFPRFGTAFRAR